MNRREALKRINLILGGAVTAPAILGILEGCQSANAGEDWLPSSLSVDEDQLVSVVAEMIIPQTDTPGAAAAQVNRFIDVMVGQFMTAADRGRFMRGLNALEQSARDETGSSFAASSPHDQARLLEGAESAYFNRGNEVADLAYFYQQVKLLTLIGYYTSEIGATQELRINPYGLYDGDLPFGEDDRTWAF